MMRTGSLGDPMDRYTIDRKLTEGGMAEVYLGHRAAGDFDQQVVLKSVLPGFVDDDELVAMMLNEARLAANLSHPNIVQVQELVELGGRPFIVMEYLDGQNLRQIVVRALEQRCTLSLGFVCHAVAEVLAGLAHAHDCAGDDGRPLGLVHRDVSLANVIVTWSGGVKLIDFGIAKATSAADPQLTRAGQVKGKCAYMSPEQVQQRPLDARSDLFSVGVVLWELLTQRRLFSRRTEVDTMMAVCCEDAPPPSSVVAELPPALDRICARALARDPAARYQSARQMRADLEALIAAAGWATGAAAARAELARLFPRESAAALAQPLDADVDDEAETMLMATPAPPPQPSPAARPPTLRAAEVALLNQRLPGPSVYDDVAPPRGTSTVQSRVALALTIALWCLCLAVVLALVAQ